MMISQLMTSQVATASPHDSLKFAAQLMEENDFDAIPVCENGRLLSIRDIAMKAVAHGRSLEETKVAQCMAVEAKYVFADQATSYVINFMIEQQLKSLLVLDRDYELVGIVCLEDLDISNKITGSFSIKNKAPIEVVTSQWQKPSTHKNYQNLVQA
jgi:predicted transcriptional regulator